MRPINVTHFSFSSINAVETIAFGLVFNLFPLLLCVLVSFPHQQWLFDCRRLRSPVESPETSHHPIAIQTPSSDSVADLRSATVWYLYRRRSGKGMDVGKRAPWELWKWRRSWKTHLCFLVRFHFIPSELFHNFVNQSEIDYLSTAWISINLLIICF